MIDWPASCFLYLASSSLLYDLANSTNNLEQQATLAGKISISLDFMLAHRPTSMPFGRPAANS